MFFLPTHRRPERCQEVLDACAATGMTAPSLVLVNGGDQPAGYGGLRLPANWRVERDTHERPLAEALRELYRAHPGLAWYGLITDDLVPMTPDWDAELIASAGRAGIASANDLWQAPHRMHGVTVWGGDLLRAVGYWVPEGFEHLYLDDLWEALGRETGCWRTLMRVHTEHRHWMRSKADRDESYVASEGRGARDKARFSLWQGAERDAALAAIRALRGDRIDSAALAKKSLFIATPTMGVISPDYALSLANTVGTLCAVGIQHRVSMRTGDGMIGHARAILLSAFLESGMTDMLFVDDDMGWCARDVVRLLASSRDVIGGAGPKKRETGESYCVSWLPGSAHDGVRQDAAGLIEVDALGTGFLRVSRAAALRMTQKYCDLEFVDGGARHVALFDHGARQGGYVGEDIAFCRRWRAMGGQVWLDPRIRLNHVGTKTWHGDVSRMLSDRPGEVVTA